MQEQCDVVITLRMIKHGQMVILVQKLPQEKLKDSFCSVSLFACLLVIVVVFNFVNKLLTTISDQSHKQYKGNWKEIFLDKLFGQI